MKKMIIASSSSVYGSGYLEYLLPVLKNHFKNVKTLVFIPYARPSGISYDDYTALVTKAFFNLNIKVKGIHEFTNPAEAILTAEAIFTGGGNTFELVHQLYKNKIMAPLQKAIATGIPYLGTSAGSNICGVNMMNTNDMPIVYPPSFNTLNVISFNINAHYTEPAKDSKHMGETRETRIKEFHIFNTTPVLGLREGSWLEVINDTVFLKGNYSAKLFQKDKPTLILKTDTEVCL